MKEWTSEFNPFNSNKLYAHLDTWSKIQRGKELPPPILVTVDPTNLCNLACNWCNSEYLRKQNSDSMSRDTLRDLGSFIKDWGVRAVCIAGGGEPTLNTELDYLVDSLTPQVKVGMVTNGTYLENHKSIEKMDWLGVSVDAGTRETYEKLKGRDMFDKVIGNIRDINKRLVQFDTITEDIVIPRLGEKGQGHGVSYKYLLHPGNCAEVYEASKLAKDIGCRNMHIRPMGNPWDRTLDDTFSYGDIETFKEQIEQARELEDEDFRIFGVTHKFDGNFNKQNDFKECYAIFMTADFQPSKDGIAMGLCCDRRGDKKLLTPVKDISEVKAYWGSPEHWKVFDSIKPEDCPRCTYQPHNKIFQEAVKTDNLTYDFI